MGINSVLTPKDLSKGKPVDPGWYKLKITDYKEEPTKDKKNAAGQVEKVSDGSLNAIFEFTAIEGPDSVNGRKFVRYFNEKALGFGNSLWATLFPNSYDKENGGELNSQMFKSTVGQVVMGYVTMDGKYPTIEDYRPV